LIEVNQTVCWLLGSGRTPAFDRRSFPVPHSTCSWRPGDHLCG